MSYYSLGLSHIFVSVLSKDIHNHVDDYWSIFRSIFGQNLRCIFSKSHIFHIVKTIFNSPMISNAFCKNFCSIFPWTETGYVIRILCGYLFHYSSRDNSSMNVNHTCDSVPPIMRFRTCSIDGYVSNLLSTTIHLFCACLTHLMSLGTVFFTLPSSHFWFPLTPMT